MQHALQTSSDLLALAIHTEQRAAEALENGSLSLADELSEAAKFYFEEAAAFEQAGK